MSVLEKKARKPEALRRFNPYSFYKDSGIEWLGKVPEHWRVKRLRYIGRAVLGLTYQPSDVVDETEGILVLRSSNIQNGRISLHDNVYVKAEVPEKLVTHIGDILICSRNGSRALIGKNAKIVESAAGKTFGAFMTVFRTNFCDYLYYVFNSPLFEYQSGAFLTSTINQLTVNNLYSFEVPLPPVEEQTAIAAFLDRETERIDALIAKKERQIKLLQEKRSALISHVVTKGLNPDAKMKDSGIEWLGEIPEHWEVLPFKRLGDFQAGAGFPDEEQGLACEELPFYKVSDTNLEGNEAFMVVHNNSITRETAIRLRAFVFPPEAIVFAKVGAALLLNKRRILTRESCIDNNMMGFMRKNCELRWIYYWLCGLDLGRLANPGAVPSINEGQLREISVPVPSSDEQRSIAAFLDRETARIDALIKKIQESVDKLREYRSALISAAVTGKIDVREEKV